MSSTHTIKRRTIKDIQEKRRDYAIYNAGHFRLSFLEELIYQANRAGWIVLAQGALDEFEDLVNALIRDPSPWLEEGRRERQLRDLLSVMGDNEGLYLAAKAALKLIESIDGYENCATAVNLRSELRDHGGGNV